MRTSHKCHTILTFSTTPHSLHAILNKHACYRVCSFSFPSPATPTHMYHVMMVLDDTYLMESNYDLPDPTALTRDSTFVPVANNGTRIVSVRVFSYVILLVLAFKASFLKTCVRSVCLLLKCFISFVLV